MSFQMKEIIDENVGDLAAAERDAAKQGKEVAKKQGKGKAKTQTKDKDSEDLDLEALQQVAADSATTLVAMQESIAKATEPKPMDSIGNFGTYLIGEMRAMSKGRYKVFKRDVQALLLKYQSSTDEDEERIPPAPKRSYGSGMQSSSGACGGFGELQSHPFNVIPNPPSGSQWQSDGRGYAHNYYNRMPQYQQQYQGSPQQHCVSQPQQSQHRQSQPSSRGPDPSTITTMALLSSGINLDPPTLVNDSPIE